MSPTGVNALPATRAQVCYGWVVFDVAMLAAAALVVPGPPGAQPLRAGVR